MTITDTRDMVLVHRVFRREFGLLPLMVRGVADEDTTSASRVFRHATEMIDALHHHHQNEDELLWPRLLQRAPLDAGLAERMEAQHKIIGELLTRAEAALPTWQRTARAGDGDALAGDLGELHARLEEHLDEEETHVLPIVGQNITPTEWDELAERGFAAMPKRRALVFLGHILESASPDERSRFLLRRVPPQVRLLYLLIGKRTFTRETAALRAGLPPSRKTPATFTPSGQRTEKTTP
jgi:hemerythrin-like domain-containing protein